ncbi:MAG: sugar ABC transporter permease [Oscillospiraceae bacterium]|nr:sugar ABC transporter permease [Oscillospiraceae bacterium]
MKKKHKLVSYAKWGYIFIAPFFIVYAVAALWPLISTFYYSFFEYREQGLNTVGPNFVGLKNYVDLFTTSSYINNGTNQLFICLKNTMIMWILGAVPQFVFSLLLAVIFTSARLRIKGQRFFKTVIYMPNLIMAASFALLFFAIFSPIGPINQIMMNSGGEQILFFQRPLSARLLVAGVNFLMWFGNTTILLMAGIMGIDQSLFEAASIDGATSIQVFGRITMPLLMPIMVYVAITSLIGGLQMFDVPQILTNRGQPNNTCKTLIIFLNGYISGNRNYGVAGAISVLIFIVTGILSLIVYKTMVTNPDKPKKKAKKGV